MIQREWISYTDQLQDQRWKAKRQEILQRDNHKCQMCSSSGTIDNPLEIHHRFYLYPAYAWQYNNEVLITLCARCHSLVHLTLAPLSYAYNHNHEFVIMNFTPCLRCNGAGYFREYKHVENGICFRCRGERYEELIDKEGKVSIEAYYNYKDTIFDVAQLQITEMEIIDYYEKGIDYLEGKNGCEKNKAKAHDLLYQAAINGHKDAQSRLATEILLSVESLKDRNKRKEAFRWHTYAAMKGKKSSAMKVAALLKTGIAGKQSDFYAKEWESIACRNENEVAVYYLEGMAIAYAFNSPYTDFYKKLLNDLANKGNKLAVEFQKSANELK